MTCTQKIFFSIIIILISISIALPVAAKTCKDVHGDKGGCKTECPQKNSDLTYGLCSSGQVCCLNGPVETEYLYKLQIPILNITAPTSLADYIGLVYKAGLYIIVPIAILVIIYAGVLWITAAGEQSKIQKAKSHIIYAFLGLFIALFSAIILSTIGIKELRDPNITYIKSIPFDDLMGSETPTNDRCDANNTSPACTGSTAYYNSIFHKAEAAEHSCSGIETKKCANCADVQEIKQCCPDEKKTDKYSFGGCGNLCSSGCGMASLAMVLNYYGKNVTVEEVIKQTTGECSTECWKIIKSGKIEDWDIYCKPSNCYRFCWWNQRKSCNTSSCSGPFKDIYIYPAQELQTENQGVRTYGPSAILEKYKLKGESLTGVTQSDSEISIRNHLRDGHPIILNTSNKKVTGSGHFIVLIGCENCDDDKNYKIYYRDPNRNSAEPFTPKHNLFSTVGSAYYIYEDRPSPGGYTPIPGFQPGF